MEKQVVKHHNNNNTATAFIAGTARERNIIGDNLIRAQSETLQWGNRKRLRCMKIQVKGVDDSNSTPAVHRTTTVRVDRRVVRADHDGNHQSNGGHFNLRQRPTSPGRPHMYTQRILRNAEGSSAMKGHSNGSRGLLQSPDRAQDKKGNSHRNGNYYNNNNYDNSNHQNGGLTASSEKGGGGSSSGSDRMPAVWPPKFVIALTNKEKEEDFMAIKGSKLPQRPKKRAKFIQRTVNLVCPGGWLCDLTLERYEVREKKVCKKRPRGLKAMGNIDSDSE
ncbi:hypothetical protein Droror1_Dr00017574 [Drosera rotundifolia]